MILILLLISESLRLLQYVKITHGINHRYYYTEIIVT